MKKDEFTFFRGKSASRLDRFYAPVDFVKNVSEIETIPVAFSDHSAVIMKIKTSKSKLLREEEGIVRPSRTRAIKQLKLYHARAVYDERG